MLFTNIAVRQQCKKN